MRQTFTHKAVARTATDQMWRRLQRPEPWGQVSGVTRIDSAAFDEQGDLTGYRFTAPVAGIEQTGTASRSTHIPGRRMVMNLESAQLGGTIGIDLEQSGVETVVTVALTIEPKGIVTTMMFPAISAAVASRFNDIVEEFIISLES